MDNKLMEDISGAWHLAGRIVDDLPKLPKPLVNGMLPVLSTLRRLQDEEGTAKVTDISNCLHLSSPGVIRIVGDCEREGLIEKRKDETDRRITRISLTEKGNQVLSNSLDRYYELMMERLKEVSDEDWKTMIRLLNFSYEVSKEVKEELHYELPDSLEN